MSYGKEYLFTGTQAERFNSNVGNLLKKARKSAQFTQQEVASHLGVSQDTISKYERGKSTISSYNLLEFSRLYEKPITFFFMSEVQSKKQVN